MFNIEDKWGAFTSWFGWWAGKRAYGLCRVILGYLRSNRGENKLNWGGFLAGLWPPRDAGNSFNEHYFSLQKIVNSTWHVRYSYWLKLICRFGTHLQELILLSRKTFCRYIWEVCVCVYIVCKCIVSNKNMLCLDLLYLLFRFKYKVRISNIRFWNYSAEWLISNECWGNNDFWWIHGLGLPS